MNRTDVINYLIGRYGYKSYLEIGVANTSFNFDKVIAVDKTGVDPETPNIEYRMPSDDFFKQNTKKFDIIFIDGYHVAEQAYSDILNSILALSDNGTIVIHDCNPTEEIWQARTPQGDGAWTGDVWMAFVWLRQDVENYYAFVIDTDFGVGVIRKSPHRVKTLDISESLVYSNLEKNRKEWLNLIDVNDIESTLNRLDGTG